MATESGRTSPGLIAKLVREPYRFQFFQAVRLLERAASQSHAEGMHAGKPVGEDDSPREEVARFRVLPSFAFPPGEIAFVATAEGEPDGQLQMTVPFFGLTGPAGVLPQHYTQLLIDRIRRKDYSLRDFLDTFHHRLISLFYRAWRKYRFYIEFERAAESSRAEDDFFTYCLYCLVGYGTAGLRSRQDVDDPAFLYYSGHFAHAPRNAQALEAILADYFDVPAQIIQFVGQWLYLPVDDQSCMPSPRRRDDCNNLMGQSIVVGHRVWGMENRFRIRLGPLTYAQFNRFSPRGDLLVRAAQLARSYSGGEFDFDVQAVLKAEEVPRCQLGGESYLGWNTWVFSAQPKYDAQDAVFAHEGWAG